jgi:hypothetical protein
MFRHYRFPAICFLLLLLGFASEQPLQAYVDPGSGSMYFQAVLCGLLGGLFHIKKMARWIRRKKND